MKNGNELVLFAAAFALGCGGKSFEQAGDASDVTAMAAPEAGPSDADVGQGGGDGSEGNEGSDMSDGGVPGGVSTLASMQEPGAIALDAQNVYWTNSAEFGDFTVRKVPISGGPVTILASHQAAGPLAVDSTSVYFAVYFPAGTSSLRKVPLGGGTPVTLASDPGCVSALAVDATNLYWSATPCFAPAAQGSIKKCPLGGGPVTTVASGQGSPSDIAVDATSVYWTNEGISPCPPSSPGQTCDGAVMKAPIAGGTPTTLAAGGAPSEIAVDATSIYWIHQLAVAAVEIRKMPIGGGPVATLASCADNCLGLAINDRGVYWFDMPGGADGPYHWVIETLPIAGGAVRSLGLAGDDFLRSLAVDSTSAYWGTGGECSPLRPDGTSTCNGALMKLTLP